MASVPPVALRGDRPQPLLVGLLVDVSGSMLEAIDNPAGPNITRLEGFREALDDFVARGGRLSKPEVGQAHYAVRLFAYGFGFGNPISLILGSSGEQVRDLLKLPGESTSTVPINVLAEKWTLYRQHVEDMAEEMFGATPMAAALSVAHGRLRQESASGGADRPILFILSDGEPTDATPSEITSLARKLHDEEILIISCFVTGEDLTEPRRLHSSPQPNWPEPATLMFDCASTLPGDSAYERYLREYRWTLDSESKLFAQVNRSDVLKEFMNVVLSPLEDEQQTIFAS